MKKFLLMGFLVGAALYVGAASARPLSGDDASEIAKKKRADGGTRDEEREEDFRRY